MNKARILLKLIFDNIGIDPRSLETFQGRFGVQKKIYLLQLTGLDLGYRYNYYLRGPYCPSLTDDAFRLRDELESNELPDQYVLRKTTIGKINKAREIWRVPQNITAPPEEWLELLASLHFLKHFAYWPKKGKASFNEVFDNLISSKPQFKAKKDLAKSAWDRLDKLKLLEQKTLN
jgi:uncharacterized protein YwgA